MSYIVTCACMCRVKVIRLWVGKQTNSWTYIRWWQHWLTLLLNKYIDWERRKEESNLTEAFSKEAPSKTLTCLWTSVLLSRSGQGTRWKMREGWKIIQCLTRELVDTYQGLFFICYTMALNKFFFGDISKIVVREGKNRRWVSPFRNGTRNGTFYVWVSNNISWYEGNFKRAGTKVLRTRQKSKIFELGNALGNPLHAFQNKEIGLTRVF